MGSNMISIVAILAFGVLALVSGGSDVLEFKDSNFGEKIKEHDIVLVEFYAPWCGHCKRLAPEYEKAATKLKANDPPVALAKVDCTVEKSTCDRFGVGGFPTLKIFRYGELNADYDGPREADGIIKYMRTQVGPSAKELSTVAELKKFLETDEHVIVGFFQDGSSKLKDLFLKVADMERDRYNFAYTTREVGDEWSGTPVYADDIVIFQPKRLHNKFEGSQTVYEGSNDMDKLKKFYQTQLHGLCGHRTMDNTQQFERPLVVAYYNVDYFKDAKGSNYWRNRILKVAQDYKRKVNFAVSNKEDFSQELEEYGLGERKDSDKPLIAAQGSQGEKYRMEEEFSPENLKKFVDDLLAGKLEPHMKSESLPEDNDDPVKVVVGKNFKEIVNQDKDVLIEFYAPWCGHCKKLAPIWDELGEKLKGEPVVIAKMDATANDVPPAFSVTGFPTIYWVPKAKKSSPIRYNGGRELDDFVKYVAKESSSELDGWSRDGKTKKSKNEL